MTVLVDSDILIEVTRGRTVDIISRWNDLSNSAAKILFSPVSAAELWAGARPNEHQIIEALFAALQCAPMGKEIGQRAGAYLHRYRKSHGLEVADALIAASAVLNAAVLWTRNLKQYPMRELSFLK